MAQNVKVTPQGGSEMTIDSLANETINEINLTETAVTVEDMTVEGTTNLQAPTADTQVRLGLDANNNVVVVSASSGGGMGDGEGGETTAECITKTVSTDFRFKNSSGAEYPASMMNAEFIAANFTTSGFYELEIDDVSELPTLVGLMDINGNALTSSFASVATGTFTIRIDGGGAVVFTYRSAARQSANGITLGGLFTPAVGPAVSATGLNAVTTLRGLNSNAIGTYNNTSFTSSRFNYSRSFPLVASSFDHNRLAGILITPSQAVYNSIRSSVGNPAIGSWQPLSTPLRTTFTSSAGDTFTVDVRYIFFLTWGGIYLGGRGTRRFSDFSPNDFVSGSGSWRTGVTWNGSFNASGSTASRDPLEFVAGNGMIDSDGSSSAMLCVGGSADSLSTETPGGNVNVGGSISVDGSITQGDAINGVTIADTSGRLQSADLSEGAMPYWDGMTLVDAPISVGASATTTFVTGGTISSLTSTEMVIVAAHTVATGTRVVGTITGGDSISGEITASTSSSFTITLDLPAPASITTSTPITITSEAQANLSVEAPAQFSGVISGDAVDNSPIIYIEDDAPGAAGAGGYRFTLANSGSTGQAGYITFVRE